MTVDGACVGAEEMSVLMDLLSHDMLNKNQATLGYLELIHSLPGDEAKTRDFSERAASQVRASSMLLDGIRRFVSSARRGALPTDVVALRDVLESVSKDTSDIFPFRRIEVDISGVAPGIEGQGGQCIHDLFMNLFTNIVQLDSGERVAITVDAREDDLDGAAITTIRVRAPTAVMPQGVSDDHITRAPSADLSKMTRVSGIVFAGSITRALGGRFASTTMDPDANRGCAFQLSLRRGERP